MAPATIFTVAGLIGFGYAVARQESVYLVSFIWGLMLFGITIAAISTSAYALDAYRDNATEIFIMAMVFKNFFFYGLSNFINNWVANSGTVQTFNVMGGISAALVRAQLFILTAVCNFHPDVYLGQTVPKLLASVQCAQDVTSRDGASWND
jgi:hypothetical protein